MNKFIVKNIFDMDKKIQLFYAVFTEHQLVMKGSGGLNEREFITVDGKKA